MASLRFEDVITFERLQALEGPWRELWAGAACGTPFSAPAWLLAWCRHLAARPPRAVAAWRGRDLVALAPTFVYPEGGRHVLGLLGGGVSDYQDVLADDEATARALLARLQEAGRAFDLARLEALPAASTLLRGGVADRSGAFVAPQDVCPVLTLPGRLEDLAGVASSKLLADLRRQRRHAARARTFETVHAPPGDPGELLGTLFRLHGARWRARGEDGVLAGAALARFHADAARALARDGLIRMTALRLDGRPIAVLYALADRVRHYAYLQGIDPGAARLSPGTLVVAAAVERAIAEGARELDMLRGDEAYKYRWGAVDRPTYRLELHPAADRPAALHVAQPPV